MIRYKWVSNARRSVQKEAACERKKAAWLENMNESHLERGWCEISDPITRYFRPSVVGPTSDIWYDRNTPEVRFRKEGCFACSWRSFYKAPTQDRENLNNKTYDLYCMLLGWWQKTERSSLDAFLVGVQMGRINVGLALGVLQAQQNHSRNK